MKTQHAKLIAAEDAHFAARLHLINARRFNTPKQWGNSPGWASRMIEAHKRVTACEERVEATRKILEFVGEQS